MVVGTEVEVLEVAAEADHPADDQGAADLEVKVGPDTAVTQLAGALEGALEM